ncbi:MAG: hypothetical protein PUC65_15920 [Clostridiales bacterium]|nr:hypothetical protein [Clostridiales bacterium]
MYRWKNDKIRCQYDLARMTAKNNGLTKFTEEELAVNSLKSKAFQGIHDPKTRRLIELAYILGNLNGLQTADQQLEDSPKEAIQKAAAKTTPVHTAAPVFEEKLFVVACKVKSKNDKLVYVNVITKARTDAEAENTAANEIRIKNQTMVTCKVLRSYGTDTMQFQFGIGKKEQDTLLQMAKKVL